MPIALTEEEEFEFRLRMEAEQGRDNKMSYDDASKGDVAAELGRSGVRGAGYAGEFFGDVYDVARASVDQFAPESMGVEDRSVLDQINPFAGPDKGDIAREQFAADTGIDKWGEEKIRRGDNAALDFGKTALEYVVPTLTGGGAGAGRQLLKNVAATSVGAASGEALGNLTGNEYVGMAGEIAGAITGGGISRKLAEKGKSMMSRFFDEPSKVSEDVIESALAAIMQQADDPVKARETFLKAIEDGDKGTLADLMGDAGVYNIEALADKGTVAQRGIVGAQEARDTQMLERAAGVVGEGDAAAVQGLAQAKQAQGVTRINEGRIAEQGRATIAADEATTASLTRARQAVDELTSAEQLLGQASGKALIPTAVSEQSKKLASTYKLTDERLRNKNVQPLWDIVDDPNMPHVSTPVMEDMIESALSSLDKVDEIPIRREFSDEIAAIKDLGDTTHPSKLAKIVSAAKKKARDRTSPASNYQRQIDDMMGGLEGLLENTPVSGPAYRKAADAESAHIARMKPAGLGKARRGAKEGELLASKLATDLEAGAVTGDQILASRSPAVIKTFKDTMRAMANRANSSGTLDSFLRKHDELLTRFPDVHDDLIKLNQAQGDFKDLTKQVGTVVSQESKVQDTITSGLTQAKQAAVTRATGSKSRLKSRLVGDMTKTPKATIDKILKSETAVDDINTLMRTVGKTPEGKQNLRKLVTDRFTDGIARSTDGVISPKVVEEFKNIRGTLEDTGLMDAAELKALDQIYDMTSATGLRGGAAQQANTQLRKGERLMTSLFAALSMKVVPGNSLIMAGAAKQWMKDQMLKVPDPNVMLALETMTKNPAAFKRAVDKYKPKDEKGMQAMLTAMLKDAAGWVTGITTPPLMVQSGDDNTLRPN